MKASTFDGVCCKEGAARHRWMEIVNSKAGRSGRRIPDTAMVGNCNSRSSVITGLNQWTDECGTRKKQTSTNSQTGLHCYCATVASNATHSTFEHEKVCCVDIYSCVCLLLHVCVETKNNTVL